jgi:hypothetical protein
MLPNLNVINVRISMALIGENSVCHAVIQNSPTIQHLGLSTNPDHFLNYVEKSEGGRNVQQQGTRAKIGVRAHEE